MKNFARRAKQGIPCTFVDAGTGQCHHAEYSPNKNLDVFTIQPPSEMSTAGLACAIAAIDDIHVYKEGGEV